jgi:hypothetical protein
VQHGRGAVDTRRPSRRQPSLRERRGTSPLSTHARRPRQRAWRRRGCGAAQEAAHRVGAGLPVNGEKGKGSCELALIGKTGLDREEEKKFAGREREKKELRKKLR